jgi:hypothetical protein
LCAAMCGQMWPSVGVPEHARNGFAIIRRAQSRVLQGSGGCESRQEPAPAPGCQGHQATSLTAASRRRR